MTTPFFSTDTFLLHQLAFIAILETIFLGPQTFLVQENLLCYVFSHPTWVIGSPKFCCICFHWICLSL